MAISWSVATKNCLRKIIPKKAINGEKSIDSGGKRRRMGSKIGSVILCKDCTIGLNGSGETQLIIALKRIKKYNIVNMISNKLAEAFIKFPITNMFYP